MCQQDKAYVQTGSQGYCGSCWKTVREDRVKMYDRPRVQGWIGQAACAKPGVNADWFFPIPGDNQSVQAARFVCAGCPVSEMCTLDTKVTGDKFGVRAGVSAFQRSGRAAA